MAEESQSETVSASGQQAAAAEENAEEAAEQATEENAEEAAEQAAEENAEENAEEADPGQEGSEDVYEVISDEAEKAEYHTVTFVAEGQEVMALFVADGARIDEMPEAPEIPGKGLIGWYEGNEPFRDDTAIERDYTITGIYRTLDSDLEEKKASGNFAYSDEGVFAAVEIFGSHKKNQVPRAARNESIQSDRTIVDAWTVENIKNNTRLTLEAVVTGLPEGATLNAYRVADGKLEEQIRENLRIGDVVSFDLSMKGAKGIALTAETAGEEEEEPIEEIEGALYANEDLYITGKVPENGIIDVTPVTAEIEDEETIAAYDIKIYANEKQKEKGKTWQPAGKKVQVHFFSEAFRETEDAEGTTYNVWHYAEGAETPEQVDTAVPEEGWINFEADSFSVYAITRTILNQRVTTSDGTTYNIEVAYTKDAGLPMTGTSLAVAEMTGEELSDYLIRTALAMDAAGFAYGRVFDISILDGDGTELQPAGPVEVTITLLDAENTEQAFSVVHFADGEAAAERMAGEHGDLQRQRVLRLRRGAGAGGHYPGMGEGYHAGRGGNIRRNGTVHREYQRVLSEEQPGHEQEREHDGHPEDQPVLLPERKHGQPILFRKRGKREQLLYLLPGRGRKQAVCIQ